MKKNRKKLWLVIGIAVLLFLLAGGMFLLSHYQKIKKDFERLQTEEYDTVFFSMYPVENYAEEDYTHFRGMNIVKTAYEIPNGKIMRKYMETAVASGNPITTAYLGVDPERTSKEDIVILIQENPEITFHVVPAYPEMDYWLGMSEKKCEKVLQTYQTFAEWIVVLENANLYFFSGEEWLICNSQNYADTFDTNVEVSQFLMCNSDTQHSYRLSIDTVEAKIDEMGVLIKRYREEPIGYPEVQDRDIVFLGDSIIGNYTNSMSVPKVVGGLTGATVYNCGYGGKSAALAEKTPICLPAIVDAIITGDADCLPEGEQVKIGVTEFLNREDTGKELTFVINYGLNDYFEGLPVYTEDAWDITSYSGALRVAVEALKEAYPQAQILLMTPNFTIYFENGETPQSRQGGALSDYAEAVLALADELQVEVLDNFHELPITEENWKIYQEDGCHLNERGRFLLGSRIAQKLEE